MEPLNKKERSNGNLRFLALFIVGILIVLIPFYFLIRLPAQQQKVQSVENSALQNQADFQKTFTTRMDSAMRMMDKYPLPDVDIDKLNADIGLILSDMDKSVGTGTDVSSLMFKKMVSTLTELKKARSANIKCTADLAKAQKNLDESQKEVSKAKSKPSDSLER